MLATFTLLDDVDRNGNPIAVVDGPDGQLVLPLWPSETSPRTLPKVGGVLVPFRRPKTRLRGAEERG